MTPDPLALLNPLSTLLLEPRTGALIGLLILAAVNDCRTRRIPNTLVLCGMSSGLLLNSLDASAASIGFLGALLGAIVGLAVMLPFYLLRAMGAGDVKLMAMAGAFLGLPQTLYAVLATCLAGGLLSLAFLAWRGVLRRTLLNVVRFLQGLVLAAAGGPRPTLEITQHGTAGSLPYGVAIAAGTTGYLVTRQLGLLG